MVCYAAARHGEYAHSVTNQRLHIRRLNARETPASNTQRVQQLDHEQATCRIIVRNEPRRPFVSGWRKLIWVTSGKHHSRPVAADNRQKRTIAESKAPNGACFGTEPSVGDYWLINR
jgi:hypothetical protein